MNLRSGIVGLLLACTHAARALSLFPDIVNVPVAITTNREVSRGIASDGTNFLVVFQGDNLYAAPDTTNQLAAQLISGSGTLAGNRIDLALNGGVPLVAVGSSNYLVTFLDSAAAIRGQFLDLTGNKSGASFVIASNTAATEVGAMTFAAGQFWIAWAQTNASNSARILVQRVSPSGTNVGEALAVGTDSADQQFPTLSASATNVLVAWVARRADTNAWDVVGRYLDMNGTVSAPLAISAIPAQQAYPIGAASDGTNHLVVWSREHPKPYLFYAGWLPTEGGGTLPAATNRIFPTLFGRIVSGSNSVEFPISRSRFGQFSPVVAFDGSNYFVGWNDRRHSAVGGGRYDWWFEYQFRYGLIVQFVSRSGDLIEAEVDATRYWEQNTSCSDRVMTVCSRTNAALLRNIDSDTARVDVQLHILRSRTPAPPALLISRGSNIVQLKVGPLPEFTTLEISTNLTDWRPFEAYWWNGFQTDYEVSTSTIPFRAYFRAVVGVERCRANLRKMAWAKEQWAFENQMSDDQTPTMEELLPWIGEIPICPNQGMYVVNNLSTRTICSLAGGGHDH